jgi:signal transduction histidine kinase/ActR/RegA family two-component response regulator
VSSKHPARIGAPSNPVPAFLAGGGEAGALVRAFDWSSTPLGPVDAWPRSLKTTVGTILNSRHPMFLWWGRELIQFYNDAYTPSFGRGKHPAAMGQRGADCWQEIWPIIWPQIDDVMTRGQASWNEDQLVPIIRNGRLEEVYWTYGYSPVFDDDGAIGGTLVVCTETTSRVVANRRLRSLRALAEATSLATDAPGVLAAAIGVVSEAVRDVMFGLVYRLDRQTGMPALMQTIGLSAGALRAIDECFRTELDAIASGTEPRPMPPHVALTGAAWPEPVSQVFAVPFGRQAQRTTGYLLCGLSPRLPFDAAYREYLRQLGEHVAQGQARVEAFHVRAAVESERNSLLEQAPVATALLTGPGHVFQLANPLYLQMVGRAGIVGKPYVEAFPELAGTPVVDVLDRVYRTGEPFVTSEMLVRLDRAGSGVLEDCYFRFNLEPLRNGAGDVYGMMAVAVDVTSQVVARKKLEQAHAEREQLLRELEAASRAKDEFLAMLGHELRNPLSPILTALQLMRLRGVQGAERERDVIERQVGHVVGLVDDLLDVSRITRGRLDLKRTRVQLAGIVSKAIEQASPLIEQRRHRLDVEVPDALWVDGDPGRLAQVVANLLTNAAKYTEPGGEITVRAGRRDGRAWLTIRDTGIGIDPAMLPHVFDAFAQGHQRGERTEGGLGLGLAIVKSLVEAHRGNVAIYSEGRGRGTECLVQLPVAVSGEVTGPAAAAPVDRPAASTGCVVLVVDDNEDGATLLGDALRAMGHEVDVLFDASAALAVSGRAPDVALLDIGLPVIDGFELASRLRQREGWDAVRFVALTGYGQQHDRDRTQAAGFAAHLVKPVDPREIDAVIRRLSGAMSDPT